MTKLSLVVCVTLGGAVGCRGAATTPAANSKASARASMSSGSVDPCRTGAKPLKVGKLERSVPLLDPERPELPVPLNGCVVGIKAGRLSPYSGCTKKLCGWPTGMPPDPCCNRCQAGAMAFSTGGPYGLIPYANGKVLACSEGLDCEANRRCEKQPGTYDVIGRLSVLDTNNFRIDVEAMERVNPPHAPPSPRKIAAPCYPDERTDAVRGWSSHFLVEYGGLVALLEDKGTAARDLWSRQAALGLYGIDMEVCDGVIASWIPGVACPAPASLVDELGKAAPVVRTQCFRPMTASDVESACKSGALPSYRCRLPTNRPVLYP